MRPITFHLGKDRPFALRMVDVVELERLCDAGIGAIAARVFTGNYHASDLVETIRLGMIGGGCPSHEADITMRLYSNDRPLAEQAIIATAILSALLYGVEEEPAPQTANDNAGVSNADQD